MTRAEKFKEVFGLKIDVVNADCGFFDCSDIENCASCPVKYTQMWWDGEYEAPSQPQENCDTCKHKDDKWDSEHCDGCCGNHSGFEPQEISDRNLKMWEEIYAEEKRRKERMNDTHNY